MPIVDGRIRKVMRSYGKGANHFLIENVPIVIAILKSLLDATFWIFSQSCFP